MKCIKTITSKRYENYYYTYNSPADPLKKDQLVRMRSNVSPYATRELTLSFYALLIC